LAVYQNALDLAETKLSIKNKLMIYNDWAIIHKKMKRYDIARHYHFKTIEEAEKIQNWEVVEDGYHGLGTLYSMQSNFDQSILYYLESIRAAERWGNQKGIILTQQNISNIYFKAKNYTSAKENIEKTYRMALGQKDTLRIGAVLLIYGNIELALGNEASALEKHQAAKAIFEQKKDKPRLAQSLFAIGEFFLKKGDYKTAKLYFDQCQQLESVFVPYLSADFYSKLGKMYHAQQQFPAAIEALKKSLAKSDTSRFKEIALANHLELAEIFKTQGKFKIAYEHLDTANQLSKLLFEENNQKNLTEAKFRFDVEKRDLQINTQAQDLASSLKIRYLLGGGILLLIGLLFFTWRQMKAKQTATKRLELLMKELHHRVKNNLQTMVSLMRLQSRQVSDPNALAILNESRSRLEAISMLHQQFYRNDEIHTVNFKSFLEDLIQKLCFAYNFPEETFSKQIEVEDNILNVDTALPTALIINELLSNSFKYAFAETEHPSIRIQLKNNTLLYHDNGKGIDKEVNTNQTASSFGVLLITSLAKQLNAKHRFYNEEGMGFEMKF
jgi:two-component sensor histidine kinase